MYRFVSLRNSTELKKAYLEKYNTDLLQRKLNRLMTVYPEIKAVLPEDMSVKKLLVGNFKYLTKVYSAFTGYLNGRSTEERTSIKLAFVKGGFNYDSHNAKIADFLTTSINEFEIYNCVYCDLESVRSFVNTIGVIVRRFETEHVLDKGECPLVAMSLYNFVPSCGICNGPAIKGTKTIGDTEEEISKLSPTAEGYDFDEKVDFVVNVLNPYAKDLKPLEHMGDYEVDFDVRNSLYYKSIDLFELKNRYNEELILAELLSWREKRRQNPDNIVQGMADLKQVSFEEMFEEMFELRKNKALHKPREKARREVMLMK